VIGVGQQRTVMLTPPTVQVPNQVTMVPEERGVLVVMRFPAPSAGPLCFNSPPGPMQATAPEIATLPRGHSKVRVTTAGSLSLVVWQAEAVPGGPAVPFVPLVPGVPFVPFVPFVPGGPRGPAGQDAQLNVGEGVVDTGHSVAVAFFVVWW